MRLALLKISDAVRCAKLIPHPMQNFWLDGKGYYPSAQAAWLDGSVYEPGIYVRTEMGLRPALYDAYAPGELMPEEDTVMNGTVFTAIGDGILIAKETVAKMAYSDSGNDYESSSIKKYLDGWWKKED